MTLTVSPPQSQQQPRFHTNYRLDQWANCCISWETSGPWSWDTGWWEDDSCLHWSCVSRRCCLETCKLSNCWDFGKNELKGNMIETHSCLCPHTSDFESAHISENDRLPLWLRDYVATLVFHFTVQTNVEFSISLTYAETLLRKPLLCLYWTIITFCYIQHSGTTMGCVPLYDEP